MDKGISNFNVENIQKTMDRLNELTSRYIDTKESLEDLADNEYLEVLGDASSFIKFVRSSVNFISKKKFESFLNGFCRTGENIEEELNKLAEYMNSETKAEFVAESISKVMFANSKKAVFVMGTIISKLTNKESTITYTQLICIDALAKCFDYDLINTLELRNFVKTKKRRFPNNGVKSLFDIGKELYNYCLYREIDFNSMKLTIEKLISLQLLIKETDVELDIDGENPEFNAAELDVTYQFTEVGINFLEYINVLEESHI